MRETSRTLQNVSTELSSTAPEAFYSEIIVYTSSSVRFLRVDDWAKLGYIGSTGRFSYLGLARRFFFTIPWRRKCDTDWNSFGSIPSVFLTIAILR